MGQQISHAGDQTLQGVHEHQARTHFTELDFRYLSSRVEKLIKLAQSSLATRVHDQPTRNSNARKPLLPADASMISPAEVSAKDTIPVHFAVDFSCASHEYDMGVPVSDVILEPVGLYCHVPMRKVLKVHSCNTGRQVADENDDSTLKPNNSYFHLLTKSSAESRFSSAPDTVTVNEKDVAKSEVSDTILPNRHQPGMVYDVSGQGRSRPPQSPKLMTPATVFQLAQETRPSEIGSYLTVAPVVSSTDLGLSPIDETAEVPVFAAPVCQPNMTDADVTSELTASICNTSSDALSSGSDCTQLRSYMYAVHNSEVSHPFTFSFDYNTTDTALSQPEEGIAKAESSVNSQVLGAVNVAFIDGKFSEDACHSPIYTYFSAADSRIDETDKHSETGFKNTPQFAFSSPLASRRKGPVWSDTELTKRVKSNVTVCRSPDTDNDHELSESKSVVAELYSWFLSEDDSVCSPQTSASYFELADTVNRSKNKDVDVHSSTCRSDIDVSAFESVLTEWETALSCCHWSSNNNASRNPEAAARAKMPSAPVPLIARRQVRHSSDSSSLSSSNFSSPGEHTSNSVGQQRSPPTRSSSQLSLDDVIVSPRPVPERLDFQQLEKFEGKPHICYT